MDDNPYAYIYSANFNRNRRGEETRIVRSVIADRRAVARSLAIEARDTNRSRLVECIVEWINKTFNNNNTTPITDLPEGMLGSPEMCPIANAVAKQLDLESVEVGGNAVELPGGDEYSLPACAITFIKLFDSGYFPEYADPMYDEDAACSTI